MNFRRFAALSLALLMVCSLLPAGLAEAEEGEAADLWAQIYAFEEAALARKGARGGADPTAEDFAALSEAVEQLVVSSGDCLPGSVIRRGSFFYWTTREGEVCGYSPRLRARIHAAGPDREADPEALSGAVTTSFAARGGSPGGADVAVFQPYKGLDSSFTDQYPNEGIALAQALGGASTTYTGNAATVDQIAQALEDCAVVIFDSHGETDCYYYNLSGHYEDRVTEANTSYLCMQTNAGWTAADQAAVEGPYGTYYHCYNGGSADGLNYYCVDGTVFASHMTKPGANNFLWMAICLGMATDGLCKPLREKGVEVVYGYSQSVTFSGDYTYEGYFWDHMRAGHTVGDSFAYMKTQAGCNWDPAYSFYSLIKARYKCVAFPNVVSSEDSYQGHRTVNPASSTDSSAGDPHDPRYGACCIQTVNSSWTLFPQYRIEAVPNNEEWGTVSVSGNTIYACPKVGCYTAGYELLSGSAEITQNGDVFTLVTEGDCTVQINFASKTSATVSFVTPEGVSCEAISTYVGDGILLPAPVGAPAAGDHAYSFVGWTEQPVPDTEAQPDYLEADSLWTVDAESKTFYALYSYTVRDDSTEGKFVRLDRAPADWSGDYVLTWDGQVVLDASGRYTGTALGSAAAAAPLESTGMRLEDGVLYDVPEDYVYVIEESGTYPGTFTIRMKGSEHYLLFSGSGDVLSTGTDGSAFLALWDLSWDEDAVTLRHALASACCLQYDPAGRRFCCSRNDLEALTVFTHPKDPVFFTTDLGGETCPGAIFTDMPARDHWAHAAIDWALVQGITTGTSETAFSPGAGCTRAQVVTFLWRAAGSPEPAGGSNPFTDVKPGAYYEKAVLWASETGVTAGTAADRFSPGKTCTRAQIVTFLWRFEGMPAPAGADNPFTDVKPGAYYEEAVLWAAETGVTAGTTATTFSPGKTCTRAQVVTFLYRDLAA